MSMLFKRIKDWAVSITSFRTGDVIPVDGPSGTAKMPYSDLAKEVIKDSANNTAATEADMTADAKLPIMTAGGPKALPANLVAKASDVSGMLGSIHKLFSDKLDVDICVANIFDKNAQGVAVGKYLLSDGTLAGNQSYNTSDFIPIVPGTSYVIGPNIFRTYCVYDANKKFIESGSSSTLFIAAENAAFIRFSIYASMWETEMVSPLSLPPQYMPYGTLYIRPSVLTHLGVTIDKIGGSLSLDQCSFFKFNLFDKDAEGIAIGKFLASSGDLYDNALYNTTDFISVIENTTYKLNTRFRSLCVFNDDGQVIYNQESTLGVNEFTVPVGGVSVRMSLWADQWNATMLSTPASLPGAFAFIPYGEIYMPGVTVSVDADKLNGYINPTQCSFFKFNLFDKDAEGVAIGKYLTSSGNLYDNAQYNTTDFIPVVPGKVYKSNKNCRFLGCFDSQKNLVSDEYYSYISQLTTAQDVYFVRITYNASQWDDAMFSLSENLPTEYVRFGYGYIGPEYIKTGGSYVPPQFDSHRYTPLFIAKDDMLSASSPLYVTKNIFISSEIFGSIETVGIGVSYLGFYGAWVEISANDVVVKKGSEGTVVQTIPHGLTLDERTNICLWCESDGNGGDIFYLQIITESAAVFKSSVNLGHPQGTCFVRNMNESGTLACTLSVFARDADMPVWMFGDSYLSYPSNARWLTYINKLGFSRYLLSAVGGLSAQQLLTDFNYLIAGHAKKPTFAVWLAGMNGGDDSDDGPNAGWLSATQHFVQACLDNKVTPVLATIPSVPTKVHVKMNEWIKLSGVRYIDLADAVEHVGTYTWKNYGEANAYLSSDLVHPSESGAKALAARVLRDFPEISVL